MAGRAPARWSRGSSATVGSSSCPIPTPAHRPSGGPPPERAPASVPADHAAFDNGAGPDYACSDSIAARREHAMKDLAVILQDRPGRLGDLGEATGRAGINIEGVCGTTEAGQSLIHVLVEDAEAARS